MHTIKTEFENPRGQLLSAVIDRPVDDRPVAYAIFAHCFTCSKTYKAVRHISRALAAEGFAVLSFDFTGLGDSEGDFAETSFTSNVDDVVAAAEFLDARHGAPTLLIGHSLGGAAVIMAALKIPSAAAVVTIAAPSDLEHLSTILAPAREEIERKGSAEILLAGRRIRIGRALVRDLDEIGMTDAISELGRALLVMHSPVDTVVGISHASRIFRAAKHPKSFVSLDRADHLLGKAEDSRYAAGVIATWAAKYLPQRSEETDSEPAADNLVVVRTGAEGYRTEIVANGHALIADEPVSVGGTDAGPTPYELLAASLGACTTMTLRMYADRKGWPLEGVEVRLEHSKIHCLDCAEASRGRPKIDHLSRELVLDGPLDDEQRRRLVEIADRCPVHRTLHSEIHVTTTLADHEPEG